jgi:ribosome biogenesis GTPase
MIREGLVVQHGANRYLVVDDESPLAEPWACGLRGRLRQGPRDAVRLAVIGDRVRFRPGKAAGERAGSIEDVLPRRNSISRPAPTGDDRRPREQVLVANLDRLWVVVARDEPPAHTRFIDRILAAAAHQGVPAGLVVNKVDLGGGLDPRMLVELYEQVGIPVLLCSATANLGLDILRQRLAAGICCLVGPSGAGKSSLVSRLSPHLELRIGAVAEKTGQGKHTTTVSRLYRLDDGGYLADTPGLREFGLWGMLRVDLALAFPDLAQHAHECRFRDCLHVEEPGCAVRTAAAEGRIAPLRYASYRALLDELPGSPDPSAGARRGRRT